MVNDFSDSDEERDEAFIIFSAASIHSRQERQPFYVRDRLLWQEHVTELRKEGPDNFTRLYRMSYEAFSQMCDIIRPNIEVNEEMSMRRTGKPAIITEIGLHCLLRWLAGGSYHDIRMTAGISHSSFYRIMYKIVDEINSNPYFGINFPSSSTEIQDAADDFANLSSHGVITGCVGCLDGFLLPIQTPSTKETGHVKAYFSGHYQRYGINIQAVCDAKLRFIYVAVAAPGGTNDIQAYRQSSLPSKVINLPLGKYLIGDNAYTCTEHLITPFAGEDRRNVQRDAYNFYVSQLRIRIEMAFGRLTGKWRILRQPLQSRLKNIGRLFMCMVRLHNYSIDIDPTSTGDCDTDDQEGQDSFLPSDFGLAEVPGNSMVRQLLVEKIARQNLVRPRHNIDRND